MQHEDTQPPSGTQPASATANGDGASEMVSLSHLVHSADRLGGMVVRSAQVRKVLKSVSQLSPYKATVLISGESGTGKELVARALHTLGPVPNGPFVTLNCSNLVESLAESQLFGHVRGAFTDARDESQGYFRSANGGTLFLDEIGELPLKLQPKLLRSVETHEVQPVGSSHCYKVNLRLVAATNRDLRAMVKAGTFRDDLYFRMSAAAIFIPPLRERREAIPAFIGYFIEQYNRLFGKDVSEISRAAIDVLCAYQWPGNVRELSNAIESAVILSENNRIVVTDLPEQIVDGTGAELLNPPGEPSANGHEPAQVAQHAPPDRFRLGAAGVPARRRDQEDLGALARRDRRKSPPRRRLARRLTLDALPDADPLRHRRKSAPPLSPANSVTLAAEPVLAAEEVTPGRGSVKPTAGLTLN